MERSQKQEFFEQLKEILLTLDTHDIKEFKIVNKIPLTSEEKLKSKKLIVIMKTYPFDDPEDKIKPEIKQCIATTQKGKQCKIKEKSNGLCHIHFKTAQNPQKESKSNTIYKQNKKY